MSGNVPAPRDASGVSFSGAFGEACGGATISVDWQPPLCWEASSAQTRRNRCSHHCSCLPQQTLR